MEDWRFEAYNFGKSDSKKTADLSIKDIPPSNFYRNYQEKINQSELSELFGLED